MMQFKFDARLPFQMDAINAVVDLFDGQHLSQGDFEIRFQDRFDFMGQSTIQQELGFGNNLVTADDMINSHLKAIQKRNNIHQEDDIRSKGKNFAIEMETGTGKTYVYLRTTFALNQKYGFKKFIIVVPSVAIREGVLKSIDIMKEHLRELYSNVPFSHFVYDSKRVSQLRSYAAGNDLQIMIINIDAFKKKDINIIHTFRDQMGGRRPVDFIQATNPIVIMDEPQNMESDKAKEAIQSLNPMCTLRYSATHRDRYNLVYQLNPVQAFQMKLVKKISVASVLGDNDPASAYLKVVAITNKGGKFSCKLKYFKQTVEGPASTTGTFKQNDDLFVKSGERDIYRNGFIITEINAKPGMEFIRFANGLRLSLGDEQGGSRDEIVKKQIRETIKAHFEKELQVKNAGIKVLSLFFLDRVANYRIHADDGPKLGPYAKWFEEMYKELAEEYRTLFDDIVPVDKVHDGYFSKDNKGRRPKTTPHSSSNSF